MLRITREELRIIVEGPILNTVFSMSINTRSYESRLTLTPTVPLLIFVSQN